MTKPINPIYYIYLAVGCMLAGIVITFIVILVSAYYGIDLTASRNLWVLAIPVVTSVLLNVILLEVYRRYHK